MSACSHRALLLVIALPVLLLPSGCKDPGGGAGTPDAMDIGASDPVDDSSSDVPELGFDVPSQDAAEEPSPEVASDLPSDEATGDPTGIDTPLSDETGPDSGDTGDAAVAGDASEVSCTPQCEGKTCGADGCGGTCGSCPPGLFCDQGTCGEPPACWTGPCPSGYQAFDGCRCKVPPSGVTHCVNNTSFVDCATLKPGDEYYGQDGQFQVAPLSFADLGDGMVLDSLTGLVWSKASYGPSSWQDAQDSCASNQPGLPETGWRLPTTWELAGILNQGKTCPMWDPVFGESCPSPSVFWSSTPDSVPLSGPGPWAYLVDFGVGAVHGAPKADEYWFRCVRGAVATTDSQRFIDQGDAVFDRLTGIQWEKVSTLDVSWGRWWTRALWECEQKGTGWRVPNAKEILSVMDLTKGCVGDNPTPTIADPLFEMACGPDSSTSFWSSTPTPDDPARVYQPRFGGNNVIDRMQANTTYWDVWCVRGG